MTLYQFKFLDQKDQLTALSERTVYLKERIDGEYTFKLFQLDSFYIEEQWHTKFNVRRSFIAFISEENLKPYLANLDLPNLLQPNSRM